MLRGHLLHGLGIPRKDFLSTFILVYNVLTWYSMILITIEVTQQSLSLTSTVLVIFYVAAVGSSIAGSILPSQVKRLHVLYFWMALGTLSSLLLLFTYNASVGLLTIIFLLLGISFGLGMPSCLAYLADHTLIESRGCVSALTLLAANFSVFPLAQILMTLNLTINFLILAIWRGLGLFTFLILKPAEEENSVETRKQTSFKSVFQDKPFLLYFVAWLMFTLVDGFEKTVLGSFLESYFHRLILMMQPIIASFFVLVGGVVSDRIGRKRVTIYGFVALGIAYAIIGIAPTIQISWYFYLVADSIAFGILSVIFTLILWGDLSQLGNREKYYVIGNVPFLIRNIIPSLLYPLSALVPAYATFSLASFFLFIAILPLMYAPETLPEKRMEIRRLKGYIEQAKKFTEKHTKKTGSKS